MNFHFWKIIRQLHGRADMQKHKKGFEQPLGNVSHQEVAPLEQAVDSGMRVYGQSNAKYDHQCSMWPHFLEATFFSWVKIDPGLHQHGYDGIWNLLTLFLIQPKGSMQGAYGKFCVFIQDHTGNPDFRCGDDPDIDIF